MEDFKKTGLLTKLSVKQIEDSIIGNANMRETLFVPNVSWGFFREHEADLVMLTRAGILTEYEIKRSWSDFIADFKKDSYHADDRISYLYYYVPEVMADEAAKYIVPDDESRWKYHAGVVGYDEDGICRVHLACNYPRQKRLYVEDMYEIARLGTLRYWAERKKNERLQRELEMERTKHDGLDQDKENQEV